MKETKQAYPIEGWTIRESSFDPSMVARNESIFALANGHLGLRGNFEEGFCNSVDGTYINGFHEKSPITYGEIAYGYAKNRQVMLNIADGKVIRLFLGDEPLDMSSGKVLAHERCLDLRTGVLSRLLRWRSPKGIEIELSSRRLVSFTRPGMAAIDYAVTLLRGKAPIRIESVVNSAVKNIASNEEDPRIGSQLPADALSVRHIEAKELSGAMVQETKNTRFTVVCVIDHTPGPDGFPKGTQTFSKAGLDRATVSFSIPEGQSTSIRFTKYLAYSSSLDSPAEELLPRAYDIVREARKMDFESLLEEQRSFLSGFWRVADVEVEGDDALQQSLRFSIFSLLQSSGRDGRTSIAAKGLTGEGYEGHYFWDAESYVVPFFIYTHPEVARALLHYRIRILDQARARAGVMNQRGALFPWRTIGGEESSAYYPAGTAQYHINADIVYALKKYVEVTEDRKILFEGGAEIVFETARLWADLGDYIPEKGGRFCINEVTGPDEYTALVNNNLYTNLMARENLLYAVDLAVKIKEMAPGEWQRISAAIRLEDAEVEQWRRAAEWMYVPFDKEKGLYAQDDLFLARAQWDFAHTPAENYPLLLHYHPLVIYRYQVLKQPDVVLAQVLLPDRFSMAEKKRNFDYYDPLTTGDSSLSPCIQCVAAAELGYTAKAYDYFMRTARMDLDDINENVATGVHTAAMAGTWSALIHGFAGMRYLGGLPSFCPKLPEKWQRLRFRLRVKSALLEVTVTTARATYALIEGEALSILHRGRRLDLVPGKTEEVNLASTLECIIFDLDGVITDTADYHYRAWKRLTDELGLPFDRGVNERLKGVSRLESLEIILENAQTAMPSDQKNALAERKNAYFREMIATITPRDLFPGIGNLLARARAEGIKTAIASVSHNVWEVVRRLEIQPFIDHIVDPALLVKGKPDPEVFFRAAEALGVPFENCVGIEDAHAGIQAIKAARMFAVGVGADFPGADWVVSHTEELTIEELLKRFEAASKG